MRRLLFLTALLIPLSSFSVYADNQQLYSVSNENTPVIGEVLTRYLGDKMTLQRTGKYLPCYVSKSIEYSGKSGSLLTFTYSEYMELKSKVNQYGVRSYPDKIARDAFTREFKVDLNDSSVGGFKGAIFEVISADNVQIEYKMIRHFQ